MPIETESARSRNAAYYASLTPGLHDYWRKMAAPRHRVRTLVRLIEQHRPRRLADLGCGGGQLLDEIRRRRGDLSLCGIDLSPERIALNREQQPDVSWHCADLETAGSLPTELTGQFEAVVASELIEHLDRPEAMLANARALAVPGGLLLLSTQSGPLRETERRVGHQRHYSAPEMAALLTACGFEPVRVWNSGFPFHDLSKWIANLNPEASMGRFSQGSYGLLEDFVCAGLRAAFLLNSQRRGAQLFAVARRVGERP